MVHFLTYLLGLLTVITEFRPVQAPCGGVRSKCPSAVSKETDTPLPVRHWPLDLPHHSNSSQTRSASVSGAEFTPLGPIPSTGSLYFNGGGASFVEISGSSGLLEEGDSFTWILSVRPRSVQNKDRVIFEFQGDSSGKGLTFIQNEEDLIVDVYNVAGEFLGSHEHSEVFTASEWTFLGVVYTTEWGALETVKLENYDNAKQRIENFEVFETKSETLNTRGNLRIGASFNEAKSSGFDGHISCVMFYNVALFKGAFKARVDDCNPDLWFDPSAVLGETMSFLNLPGSQITSTVSTPAGTPETMAVSGSAATQTDGSHTRANRTATDYDSVTTVHPKGLTDVKELESSPTSATQSTSETSPSSTDCVCPSASRINTRSILRIENDTQQVGFRRASVNSAISPASVLYRTSVDSLLVCSKLCVQSDKCVTFSYSIQEDNGGNCRLSEHGCPEVILLSAHYVYCVHL